MMGISSDRWSAYMHERLGLGHLTPDRIRHEVIDRMIALYREQVPLLPGARSAVEATVERWPLAVASGSDRVLLDTVLASSGLGRCFPATVAGDEVTEGKPAPLIYQEACRRCCVAEGRAGSTPRTPGSDCECEFGEDGLEPAAGLGIESEFVVAAA
jgi:beta-phosphoglucomutase-like phosphatase (HAD superfamily)